MIVTGESSLGSVHGKHHDSDTDELEVSPGKRYFVENVAVHSGPLIRAGHSGYIPTPLLYVHHYRRHWSRCTSCSI
jgi:hypothetical protein